MRRAASIALRTAEVRWSRNSEVREWKAERAEGVADVKPARMSAVARDWSRRALDDGVRWSVE